MQRPHKSSTHKRQGGALPVEAIRVGDRHRKDMGDIAGLAANIAEVGLLHPIVVQPDGTLIAGERRLRAVQSLGKTEIAVTVIDLDNIVAGEFAENNHRKDFTLSEAVAIKRALEPIERAAAKQRQRGSKGRGKKGGQVAPPLKGRAADKAAKATGMTRRTLEKAEAIVDAAEADPEKFGKLLADMDRSHRVNGPYKRLRNAQQAEQIRSEAPPLPSKGPYRVAVVDSPWAYEPEDENAPQRGALPYPTMSIEQICALDVSSIMHPDSIIWLWVTNYILVQGLHLPVLRAWRFEPKTLITWPKDRMGNGDWLRGKTEHCLMAVRGKPIVTITNQTTLLQAPMRGHSVKPPEFYDLVESLCPAPRYADLFSRYQHNDKWDCHGDEVSSTTDRPDDIPGFLRRVKEEEIRRPCM